MTPTQQAALEGLVNRELSVDEITLATMRSDSSLAESLSVGRTRVESKQIGRGTILAVMAPMGGLFLGTLRDIGDTRPRTIDSANVAEVVGLIDRGEFDIGMEDRPVQLQLFASANADIAPGIAALLALPVVPDPLSVAAVSAILNSEG